MPSPSQPDSGLAGEICTLLAGHASEPVDFMALYMFLNTAAGGHFEDRHSENEIAVALLSLLADGSVQAWEDGRRIAPPQSIRPGSTTCAFRLASD